MLKYTFTENDYKFFKDKTNGLATNVGLTFFLLSFLPVSTLLICIGNHIGLQIGWNDVTFNTVKSYTFWCTAIGAPVVLVCVLQYTNSILNELKIIKKDISN